MRSRPRRPYKNFGLFCFAHGSDAIRPYPCLVCRGKGTQTIEVCIESVFPEDNYRLDRPIRCATCHGTGQGTKAACRQAYQKILEAHRQACREYDRLTAYRRQALKKLTKVEIRILQELGV